MGKGSRQRPGEIGAALESLPRAELEVLACLWQRGRATARQVREAMAGYRPMSHGSMVTLLKRLEAKGLLTKEKAPVGKAFVFEPTRGPERTYRKIMSDLHDKVFYGNGVRMMASLFEARPPTLKELENLQELLDDLRQKEGEG